MPNEHLYALDLDDGVRMRIRFLSERGQIVQFLVQLETLVNDDWLAVVCYDNAHGHPHRDLLDRWGRLIHKEWLSLASNEIFTFGISDVRANWEHYVERFLEDR